MNYRSLIRGVKNYKVSLVIKLLILSDTLLYSAMNLLAPIYALFIQNEIVGANITTVGIASALYLISRSIFEVPVGIMIDKIKGEKDDWIIMVSGLFLVSIAYFGYMFVGHIWQVFLLQIILGLAAALANPTWCKMFTRHLDKGEEGVEWSMYDVIVGVGAGLAAALGAFIADIYGFDTVFFIVGIVAAFSAIVLLFLKKELYKT